MPPKNKRPKLQGSAAASCESAESIRRAALRELLAWEPVRGDVDEAERPAPVLASAAGYVSAWVGTWLRETRCGLPRCVHGCLFVSLRGGQQVRGLTPLRCLVSLALRATGGRALFA